MQDIFLTSKEAMEVTGRSEPTIKRFIRDQKEKYSTAGKTIPILEVGEAVASDICVFKLKTSNNPNIPAKWMIQKSCLTEAYPEVTQSEPPSTPGHDPLIPRSEPRHDQEVKPVDQGSNDLGQGSQSEKSELALENQKQDQSFADLKQENAVLKERIEGKDDLLQEKDTHLASKESQIEELQKDKEKLIDRYENEKRELRADLKAERDKIDHLYTLSQGVGIGRLQGKGGQGSTSESQPGPIPGDAITLPPDQLGEEDNNSAPAKENDTTQKEVTSESDSQKSQEGSEPKKKRWPWSRNKNN